MAIARQNDYVWVEPLTKKSEFDSAIGVKVIGIDNGYYTVVDDDKNTFEISDQHQVRLMHSSSINGVEDMITLGDLHEAAILRNLHVRYRDRLIYTYTGNILVAINPYENLPIYNNDQIEKYRDRKFGELPPHIFAVGDNAYNHMKRESQSQCIIISGESGAGKTESTKWILEFLATISGQRSWVEQQVVDSNPILEAFGNAKTVRNDNSSRFGKFINVDFDTNGSIVGAKIDQYLLEKSRIVTQAKGERNYHIFYSMLAGLSNEEKNHLHLTTASDYKYLNQGNSIVVEGRDDRSNFSQIRAAMKVLTFSDPEINSIFQTLAALLHLGNLIFEAAQNQHLDTTQIRNLDLISIVADLLKVDKFLLLNALTKRTITTTVTGVTETVTGVMSTEVAIDTRDAFVKSIYGRIFEWLVTKLNKATEAAAPASGAEHKSIGLLDIFGFENVQNNSFEQFYINYANERLQQFFVHHIFKLEQEEYSAENIQWRHIDFVDNQDILDLLADQPMSISSIMDEQTKFPKATDKTLLAQMNSTHATNRNYFKHKSDISTSFAIHHFAGPVVYNSTNFLEKNRDIVNKDLLSVLWTSKFPFISDLYSEALHNIDDRERKKTVGAQFKRSLEALMRQISQCHPYFVRCVKPNEFKKPKVFDRELCCKQLRYSGMMETIEIRKAGYPIRHKFEDFVFRYRFLVDGLGTSGQRNAKDSSARIAHEILGTTADYQLGKTKIFLKHADDLILETERERILLAKVVLMQRVVKGWLERRRFLRTIVAVHLIQKRWRGYAAKKRYNEIYLGFTRLQAVIRQRVQVLKYVQLRRRLRKLQAYGRGYLARKALKSIKANKTRPLDTVPLYKQIDCARPEIPAGPAVHVGQEDMTTVLNELFDFLGSYERKTPEDDSNLIESRILYQENEEFSDYKFRLFAATFFQGNATTWHQNTPLKYPLLQHEEVGDQIASLAIFTTIQRFMGDLNDSMTENTKHHEGKNSIMNELMSQVGRNFKRKDFLLAQQEVMLGSLNSAADFKAYQNTQTNSSNLASISGRSKSGGKTVTQATTRVTSAFDNRPTNYLEKLHFIIGNGILRPDLRDEIYCQICKQLSRNSNKRSIARGWVLLSLCAGCFTPSDKFIKYLRCFIREECDPGYAEYCAHRLRRCERNGVRTNPSSDIELQAAKSKKLLVLPVRSMDGKTFLFNGDSATNAYELVTAWSDRVGLKDKFGFSVYIAMFDKLSSLGWGMENIPDAISQCEQYAKERHALEARWALYFRKEMFLPWTENLEDLRATELIYRQILRGIQNGELKFKTDEDLATLTAQRYYVDFGQFVRPEHLAQQLPNMIPEYIFKKNGVSGKKAQEKWFHLVLEAHKKIFPKSHVKEALAVQNDIVQFAKSEWFMNFSRFYGATRFAGPHLPRNEVTVAVNNQGMHIIGPDDKIYRQIPFAHVMSISNAKAGLLHAETFNLHLAGGEEFTFQSPNSRDIRELVSYFLEGLKKRSRYLVAIQDYRARESGHLSLAQGDIVELISNEVIENVTNRRWISGRNLNTNQSGEFPTDAVQILPVLSAPDAALQILLKPTDMPSQSTETDFTEAAGTLETPHTLERFAQTNFKVPNKWNFSTEQLRIPLLTSIAASFVQELYLSRILDYMGDRPNTRPKSPVEYSRQIFSGAVKSVQLRDELFCQLMKQLTENPRKESETRGWELMWLATGLFAPSNSVVKELVTFLRSRTALAVSNDCSTRLQRSIKFGNRKSGPHSSEFKAAQSDLKKHMEAVHLPDSTEVNLEILSNAKGKELSSNMAQKLNIKSADGFFLFFRIANQTISLSEDEMFFDLLNNLDVHQASSTSYQVLFLKKIWTNTVPGQDKVADIKLHYYQELTKYLRGFHQCSLEDATRLAALLIKATENFKFPLSPETLKGILPLPLIAAKPFSSWESDIWAEHNGINITSDDAKIAFLKVLYRWPTFGSVFFDVKQSGDAGLPESLLVAINKDGVHLMSKSNLDILATYPFTRISNWSSKPGLFLMNVGNRMKGTRLLFETPAASTMDDLISSYVTQIFEVTTM